MAYVIGSQAGKEKAEKMKTNESWTNPADGSTWTKKADGSVSVKTSSGENFDNAYPAKTGGGSSGGNSQYTGVSLGKSYNPNADYQAIINQAKENKDYLLAAQAEQLRNQKIVGEGLPYDLTYNYTQHLVDDIKDRYKQDEFSYDVEKPTTPEKDPRIDRLLNEILNRDDFSYDVANDPLYQQYAQMYQREGDRAMKETLAEAAAGAGGMNTYAVTAAQQANNYYNSQLNDRIPELYQLAYDMYLNDIDLKVQDLGILQDMDATQYNRYRDTMSDWRNDKNFAYGMYQDAVQQDNWQKTYDYNAMWDNLTFNNNNEWKEREWNANQSQLELENNRYDEDTATEMVKWLIQEGATSISPELIAQSRFSEADVSNAIATKQSQLANKGTTLGGGSGTGAGVIGVGANTPLSESEVKSWADSLNRTVSDNYDGMQALKKTEDNRYEVADASLEFIIHRVYQSPDLTTEQKNYLLGQFGIDVTDEAVKDVMYTVATDPHYR